MAGRPWVGVSHGNIRSMYTDRVVRRSTAIETFGLLFLELRARAERFERRLLGPRTDLANLWQRAEFPLYVMWAGLCTLLSATAFYRAMLEQTGGEWSAPLDDVFIHFDYAREAARGHPFHWTSGNGYSSGNTSILYPFVLAIGWLVGFRRESLMVWAAIVAAVSVFGTLLAARRLLVPSPSPSASLVGVDGSDAATQSELSTWSTGTAPSPLARAIVFAFPPLFVSIGALDWSLWSGMEVSFFLATWALGLFAMQAVENAPRARLVTASLWLGLAGAIIVLTRPEGAVTLAGFGIVAALAVHRRHGVRAALLALVLAGLPAFAALLLQSLANLAFTGELSANGAIVKLAINHPFMTGEEKLADYVQNLRYSVFRNLEYHFTDASIFGFLLPTLAGLSLASRETRRYGALLWGQIVGWLVLVALNGQVRWQNERYTMPAVAWLLLAVVLGVYALLRTRERISIAIATLFGAFAVQLLAIATRPGGTLPEVRLSWFLALGGGLAFALLLRFVWPMRLAAAAAALGLFWFHQTDKVRDQKWFFARASRNIRDQHIVAGRWLAELKPRRILVGDAGALLYASEAKGLDIIGLGGFHDLPFARAGVHGLAATIELIERMPESERPDVMAIYPTWWGVLPTWFSSDILARFPVEGNVICGGYEDVIYRADWSMLGTGEKPRTALANETVVDSIDIADLVSERAHRYQFPHPAGGFTDMKILTDPDNSTRTLFDGGRRISPERAESFLAHGVRPNTFAHLIVRSAPEQSTTVRVYADGVEVGTLALTPSEGWIESMVALTPDRVRDGMKLELKNDGPNDFVDYHVWITQ